jgi:hypothetical protein
MQSLFGEPRATGRFESWDDAEGSRGAHEQGGTERYDAFAEPFAILAVYQHCR